MKRLLLCLLFAFSAYANSEQVVLHSFGSASTDEQMCGFGGTITPKGSGEVLIIVGGSAYVQDSGFNCFVNIRYGTGVPPKAGDAATGTIAGAKQVAAGNAAAANFGFSLNAVLAGLTVGQTYWFDVGFSTQGSFSTVGTCSMSIAELSDSAGIVLLQHGSSAPSGKTFLGTTSLYLKLGSKRKRILFDIYQ